MSDILLITFCLKVPQTILFLQCKKSHSMPIQMEVFYSWMKHCNASGRGKSSNMGRCIISYQDVLCSLPKNVNHQADEAVLCNHSIDGQLLRTSVLTGRLCFGALWNFCLSLNCDSWPVEGMLFFRISLVLSSLLSVILKTCFGSFVHILGHSVLFTHFLKHLFAPIMGRFDEPNMGLPILGSQYLVNYIFWVIKY